MRGQYKTLITPLVLSYFGTVIISSVVPQARILGFVAFLTLSLSRLELAYVLWIAALTGLYIDANSPSTQMGFVALNYVLTSLIVFRYRRHFNEDNFYIFTLYSTLFSFVSTILHFILHALIDLHVKLHLFTVITDLILMPIFDGVYALVFVLAPIALFRYLSASKRLSRYRKVLRKLSKRINTDFKRVWQHKWIRKKLKMLR